GAGAARVVGDVEVEVAVVVVVGPRAAHRVPLVVYARPGSDIDEVTGAVVAEQAVTTVVRDEEVGMTVVVVVGERRAERCAPAVRDPSLRCLVPEARIAVVDEELERLTESCYREIGPSVAVDVGPGRA